MAMASGFKWEGTKELKRTLKRMSDATPTMIAKALFQEANEIITESVRNTPVGISGELRQSATVLPPQISRSGARVEFGYGASYALWVHEGIGPAVGYPAFMPPSSAFEDWAERVAGDKSLAFAAALTVGREGFIGSKFLENAMKKRKRGMGRRVARNVAAEVKRLTSRSRR